MDPSALNTNVTIDDWACILNYTNPSDWQTPDPQSPPLATTLSTSPWVEGTYHKTSIVNASVLLNFEGEHFCLCRATIPLYPHW